MAWNAFTAELPQKISVLVVLVDKSKWQTGKILPDLEPFDIMVIVEKPDGSVRQEDLTDINAIRTMMNSGVIIRLKEDISPDWQKLVIS